jgi:Uma2 family endonuclease
MFAQFQLANLTLNEYLELELKGDIRHEYIAGQVYAMAGGSREHDIISGNLYSKLRTHLRGTGCQVFSSDMKVRIESLDLFYYPDISVTCNPQDREKYFNRYPCLIIEVTSPSTARVDRNEKLLNYRQLESLQEYLLVDQEKIQVEFYHKDDQNNWSVETLGEGDVLNLVSVGLEMTMAEIYEEVEV